MKYALYARVSTNEQTNENQTLILIDYCTKNGLQYDLYEECESSRKTRPIKHKLLQKLRKNEYSGVIVCRLDRWGRSTSELITELQEFVEIGVEFISIKENLNFLTATGRLHAQLLAIFAEFERSIISERTKEGLKRAVSQGKRLGRPKGVKDTKKRSNEGYLNRFAPK